MKLTIDEIREAYRQYSLQTDEELDIWLESVALGDEDIQELIGELQATVMLIIGRVPPEKLIRAMACLSFSSFTSGMMFGMQKAYEEGADQDVGL